MDEVRRGGKWGSYSSNSLSGSNLGKIDDEDEDTKNMENRMARGNREPIEVAGGGTRLVMLTTAAAGDKK